MGHGVQTINVGVQTNFLRQRDRHNLYEKKEVLKKISCMGLTLPVAVILLLRPTDKC